MAGPGYRRGMNRPPIARMVRALVVVACPSAAGAQPADLVPERASLTLGTSGGQVTDGGGRVLFESPAGDLVPGDANRVNDLFPHRRATGATRRISVGPGGREADGGSFNAG